MEPGPPCFRRRPCVESRRAVIAAVDPPRRAQRPGAQISGSWMPRPARRGQPAGFHQARRHHFGMARNAHDPRLWRYVACVSAVYRMIQRNPRQFFIGHRTSAETRPRHHQPHTNTTTTLNATIPRDAALPGTQIISWLRTAPDRHAPEPDAWDRTPGAPKWRSLPCRPSKSTARLHRPATKAVQAPCSR